MTHIFNIISAIKIHSKKLKDFLFRKYYRQIKFTKKNSYYPMKHQNKNYSLLLAIKLIRKLPHTGYTKEN